jgi:hypothetical protein
VNAARTDDSLAGQSTALPLWPRKHLVLRNITITVSEEAARWARRAAAEQNTSVSKLVGGLLEEQMRAHSGAYWKAYEKWKKLKPIPGLAAGRLSRDDAHERRR